MAHLTYSITETITVGDGKKKGSSKRVTEHMQMAETYTRKLSRHFTESLNIVDALRRSANAAMYDIIIRDDVLNKTDLDTAFDSPSVQHEPFRIAHPGDYKYEKAIVGIRVQGGTGLGRAGVDGLQLNVDTPDINDAGNASVTTDIAGTFIPFNRVFTVPPSGADGTVMPQFVSGSAFAMPEILSVTETGFTVILRDISSPSTLIAGVIAWQAVGR